MNTLEPIPQPPPRFFLGNIPDVMGAPTFIEAFARLAREYGPLYQLDQMGRTIVLASSHELVDELCDEKRFEKALVTPVRVMRDVAGDGLFTAYTEEPNWGKAHRILMPNFSVNAMKGYLPAMLEVARRLCDKWQRAAEHDHEVDVTADMTRLTLDTIGLCGFGYDLESFERDQPHPFIQSMVFTMSEAQSRVWRPALVNKLMLVRQQQYQDHIHKLNALVDDIVHERRKHPAIEKADLLQYMLNNSDPQSGESLDDVNIRHQIITFLIAGHETTSGLLSFAIYQLMRHPHVLERAYEEVDTMLGGDLTHLPTHQEVQRLTCIHQILKETLRLWPTAPAFARRPLQDEIVGGRWRIPKGQAVSVLISVLHRDPKIWGDEPETFDPERFSPDHTYPPNAYKPFGTGVRACIGSQFAQQEAALVLGMVLQRFKPIDHLPYKLKVKQALTVKPEDFRIKLRVRTPMERRMSAAPSRPATVPDSAVTVNGQHSPLLILYGSNMGSSERFARHIARDSAMRGFEATAAPLDAYANKLPTDRPLLVITASYNGTPPDNAVEFCQWLNTPEQAPDLLTGVRYAVFGCGHKDWIATYQAIPRLVDSRLEALGATRWMERGEADARGDFDGDFERWYQTYWTRLAETLGRAVSASPTAMTTEMYDLEIVDDSPPNPFVALFEARAMTVVDNYELHTSSGRSARHLELALPEGVSYATGDHLGVIPENEPHTVRRVASRFNLDLETRVRLKARGDNSSVLPLGQVVSVGHLLTHYVELQDVATRRQIAQLAVATACPPERARLQTWAADPQYTEQVLKANRSLIDLLEDCPACELPFARYLELLSPLRPRYYSISSSPRQYQHIVSLTVGVLDSPARSGRGAYRGVCSNFLKRQEKGRSIYAFVRDTGSAFRLPRNPETPIIMVGPGTGIAPFRGFLQERAALARGGQEVGPALLFYGCRYAAQDFLYRAELESLAAQGVVELVTAFSREDKVYVQNRILERRERVWQLLESGGRIYICGDAGRMAPDVRKAFQGVYRTVRNGSSQADAERWLEDLRVRGHYLEDVWAATAGDHEAGGVPAVTHTWRR